MTAWVKEANIKGTPGSRWYTGENFPIIELPDPTDRIEGDMYLKTIDPSGGTVWRWTTSTWVYTGANITGPSGPIGPPGVMQAVIPGDNIAVDANDPANPVVSFSPPIDIDADTTGNLPVARVPQAVAKAGDTMTGPLVLPGAPTAPLEAATKLYVDGKTFDLHALPLKPEAFLADEAVIANSETGWSLWKTTVSGLLARFGDWLHGIAQKAAIVDADEFAINSSQSVPPWQARRMSWADLKTAAQINSNQRIGPIQPGTGIFDANDLTETGWYFATSGTTANIPMADHGWIEVFNQNMVTNGAGQIQRFTQKLTTTAANVPPRVFLRGRWYGIGNPWSRWIEITPREILTANRDYYVNAATGNANNDGLTPATPLLTLQQAIGRVALIDFNSYRVFINLADGTYAGATIVDMVGITVSSALTIRGNLTTPGNVQINTQMAAVRDAKVTLEGMRFVTPSGIQIYAVGSEIALGAGLEFGTTTGYHMMADDQGRIRANQPYTIVGNAAAHAYARNASTISLDFATVTLTGTPNFSTGFAFTQPLGMVLCGAMTFVGAATGRRYYVEAGGVVNPAGGGETYLPGNVAGILQPTGIYAPRVGGLTGFYESAPQNILAAAQVVLAHGLGRKPALVDAVIQCVVADGGYAVGDEVPINPAGNMDTAINKGVSIVPDATNITVRFGSSGSVLAIIRKDTGASVNITAVNWRLVLRAWAWQS